MMLALSDTMEIWSNGRYPGSSITKGESPTGWTVPQEWLQEEGKYVDVADWGSRDMGYSRTNTLTGYLSIGSSGIRIPINFMYYEVSADNQYGHLTMALDQQAFSNSTVQTAFASFLGLQRVANLETYTGNTVEHVYAINDGKTQRIVISDAHGMTLDIWMKFGSVNAAEGTALIQAMATIVHPMGDDQWSDPEIGPYITSSNTKFTKLNF